jgi:hypothetical protein
MVRAGDKQAERAACQYVNGLADRVAFAGPALRLLRGGRVHPRPRRRPIHRNDIDEARIIWLSATATALSPTRNDPDCGFDADEFRKAARFQS